MDKLIYCECGCFEWKFKILTEHMGKLVIILCELKLNLNSVCMCNVLVFFQFHV